MLHMSSSLADADLCQVRFFQTFTFFIENTKCCCAEQRQKFENKFEKSRVYQCNSRIPGDTKVQDIWLESVSVALVEFVAGVVDLMKKRVLTSERKSISFWKTPTTLCNIRSKDFKPEDRRILLFTQNPILTVTVQSSQ